jgi:hypothetical protein
MFVRRLGPTQMQHVTGLHYKGKLLDLPENIRLGRKLVTVSNTLAYFVVELITAFKSFIVLTQHSFFFFSIPGKVG